MNARRQGLAAFALVMFLVLPAGCASSGCHSWRRMYCSSSGTWQGTFYSDGQFARLDTDGVNLVFEAVPMPLGQSSMTTTSSIRVSGGGTSNVHVGMKGKTMTSSYAAGVNTINVEGVEVTLLDSGRKAQIGTRSFDLTGSRKTLVIHQDGAVSVQ